MSADLHPHWKSTGAGNSAPDTHTEEVLRTAASAGKRVRVQRSARSRLLPNLFIAFGSVAALAFVFVQGVSFLQADLTESLVPDHTIVITEQGFDEVTVAVGDVLEFQNTLESVEQMRSQEETENGSARMAPAAIAPGGSVKLKVLPELAGETITLVSLFTPSRQGVIHVSGDAIEVVSQTSSAPAVPSSSAESLQQVEQKSSASSQQSSASSAMTSSSSSARPQMAEVQVPEQPQSQTSSASEMQAAPPTLNIAEQPVQNTAPPVTPWPSSLRVNRYTVGSAFVPAFSPTEQIPIHSAWQAEEQVQMAVHSAARSQPQTGPGLWVAGLITAGFVPLVYRRKK